MANMRHPSRLVAFAIMIKSRSDHLVSLIIQMSCPGWSKPRQSHAAWPPPTLVDKIRMGLPMSSGLVIAACLRRLLLLAASVLLVCVLMSPGKSFSGGPTVWSALQTRGLINNLAAELWRVQTSRLLFGLSADAIQCGALPIFAAVLFVAGENRTALSPPRSAPLGHALTHIVSCKARFRGVCVGLKL